MLFLLDLLDLLNKMRPVADGGSRFGIVLNGSPLFTGGAGSGESEIRRYVLENDLVEAIIGLPTDMFYNTGIATDLELNRPLSLPLHDDRPWSDLAAMDDVSHPQCNQITHPRSLLSSPKLSMANSRGRRAFWSLARIAQTSLGLSGAFWPTSFPLFRGSRRVDESLESLLHATGRLDDALAAVEGCIANAPSDADCLMYRVHLLSRLGRFDEALREVDAHMALVPVRPAYIEAFISTAQVFGRRYSDALSTSERCLSRTPLHLICQVNRLVALAESGRTREAQAAGQEMLQRIPLARVQGYVRGIVGAPEVRLRRTQAMEIAGIPM